MVKRCCFLLSTILGFCLNVPGQELEFNSVRKLPPTLNSAAEEGMPLLSPDGRQLFFTRTLFAANSGGKFSGSDIWHSEGRGDVWRSPSNTIPAIMNTAAHNVLVGFDREGKKRFFVSASPYSPIDGIYYTERINDYWTRPQLIPIPGIDTRRFVGVYVSPDVDVVFLSMQGDDSYGEEDLYFSVKDKTGQWTVPRNMGGTLNTQGFEISPFLSNDKKRLYFASNGHGGEGDADIFYSERLYDSWETWSVPVNLGKMVNSAKFDAYFSIYGDSIAYFASNRDGQFADLYEAHVTRRATVLGDGQRYFTREDWQRELGASISQEIIFPETSTTLTPSQEELLFYVANKLQLRRSVMFHLVVLQTDDLERGEKRLKSVADYLTQSGISEDRIVTRQVESPEKAGRGVIAIRLFE
jgi:hypothetical protein